MTINDRGTWGSRFGFVLAAAGSAVGLGNIWGFPTKVGQNGGGAFVLVLPSLRNFYLPPHSHRRTGDRSTYQE